MLIENNEKLEYAAQTANYTFELNLHSQMVSLFFIETSPHLRWKLAAHVGHA